MQSVFYYQVPWVVLNITHFPYRNIKTSLLLLLKKPVGIILYFNTMRKWYLKVVEEYSNMVNRDCFPRGYKYDSQEKGNCDVAGLQLGMP